MGVQYILRHFYHKYAQIVVVGSDPKSMILDIEGHSNSYTMCGFRNKSEGKQTINHNRTDYIIHCDGVT